MRIIISTFCFFLGISQTSYAQVTELIDKFVGAYEQYQYISYDQLSTSERGEGEPFRLYFEKDEKDDRLGTRFFIAGTFARVIYNGSELFTLGTKYIPTFYLLQNEYEADDLSRPIPAKIGWADSYPAYVLGLAAVRDDNSFVKTVEMDTVIDGRRCHALRVCSGGKRIMANTVYTFPPSVTISFDMVFYIDAENYLLRQMNFYNSFGSRSVTRYINYQLDTPQTELAWYLKDYPEARKFIRMEYVRLKTGETMPEFHAIQPNGSTLIREDLVGKKSFLFFWNSGCAASRQSVPVVNSLIAKYPCVRFVGFNNEDGNIETILKIKQEQGMDIDVAQGSRELGYAFGVNAWPTFLLFDTEGKLTGWIEGYADLLEEQLSTLIGK